MKFARGLFFLLLLLGGFYLYQNYLPYHFSGQKPFTPTPEKLLGYYDYYDQNATWHGQKFLSFKIPEPENIAFNKNVLGDNSSNKRIEVDLARQRVYAFEGDKKVFDFAVSTGKWGRTPTGVFTIANKIRYTKMEGGNAAIGTYYYLPNVPYVMFFGNSEIPASRGFSLHGTYWHDNFGHPMSHGCINMRTAEVEQIYYWAQPDLRGKISTSTTPDNPGTKIVIYGEAPAE